MLRGRLADMGREVFPQVVPGKAALPGSSPGRGVCLYVHL